VLAQDEYCIEVPHHIRRQFALAISGLQETAGWEGIKAYLDLLSRAVESKGHLRSSVVQSFTDQSSDNPEELWMMFLNEDCMTDAGHVYLDLTAPAPTDATLERQLMLITNRECRTDTSSPAPDAGPSSSSPADKVTDATVYERDRRKHEVLCGRKRKREHPYNPAKQDLPRFNLVGFLTTYWTTLRADGLYTNSSVWAFKGTGEEKDIHKPSVANGKKVGMRLTLKDSLSAVKAWRFDVE
jgi:hypothetical protein